MPRHSMVLADPVRRRVGDRMLETRAYHIAQSERCRKDAHGLTARYRSEIHRLRNELRYHQAFAEDALEIMEALS